MEPRTGACLAAALVLAGTANAAAGSAAWDPWEPRPAAPAAAPSSLAGETGAGRIAALAAIRVYQLTIGVVLPGSCQFSPSCSRFTAECIRSRGVLNGIWMGADRISRCHGFATLGGYAVSASGALVDPPGPARAPVPFLAELGL